MSESQHSQLSTPEALDKFIEGLLSESETTALTDALQHDPDLDFDLESYGETISLLRTTDLVPPPDMFVWQVQQRIRRRTRGRWFAPPASRTLRLARLDEWLLGRAVAAIGSPNMR